MTFVRSGLVVLCLLLVPAAAQAKVKLSPTGIALSGGEAEVVEVALSSPFKGCVRDRVVSLTDSGAGVPLQTATTDRHGRVSISLSDIPTGISALRVEALAKSFGSRLCGAAGVDVALDQATLSGGLVDGAFGGVLSSSVDACEPDRTISLYEVSSEPVFVGWNFTDASGAWRIAQAGGTYQAQTGPAIVGLGGTFALCRPLISPAWTYEEPPE